MPKDANNMSKGFAFVEFFNPQVRLCMQLQAQWQVAAAQQQLSQTVRQQREQLLLFSSSRTDSVRGALSSVTDGIFCKFKLASCQASRKACKLQ